MEAASHENDQVMVPVSLMRSLILLAESCGDVMLAEYSNGKGSESAHATAERACRVVMDQGFELHA